MLDWIRKALDKTDPTVSMKHAAFGIAVIFSCLWLTYRCFIAMDAQWVAAYAIFMGSVSVTKIAGKTDV